MRATYADSFGRPRSWPTSRRISPLISRLCELDRIDLEAVLPRIGSTEEVEAGRRRMVAGMMGHPVSVHYARYVSGAPCPTPPPRPPDDRARLAFEARHMEHGVVVRQWSDPAGALGFRIVLGRVEMEARLGTALVATNGRWATLLLAMRLPETLALAMPGRPISSLVEHPLLEDAAYRVATVWQPPESGFAMLCFDTGRSRSPKDRAFG